MSRSPWKTASSCGTMCRPIAEGHYHSCQCWPPTEAYAGLRYIIEEIKKGVPIWKKELTKDGDRWVPGEHAHGVGKLRH